MNTKPLGTVIRGTLTVHSAIEVDGGWRLTWLPNRVVSWEQAVTGLLLADDVAGGLSLDHDHWLRIHAWATELGLNGFTAARCVLWPPPPEDATFGR
jgi:hypothetical protein